MSFDSMIRLGFLYPPCGAEDELYHYGELAAPNIRVTLIGTRIFGEDDEHAVHHLSRTGQLDNLRQSAAILGRLRPSVVIWACTSGSFDGLEHARAQADAIGEAAGCAGSSTSLAFARACEHLGVASAVWQHPSRPRKPRFLTIRLRRIAGCRSPLGPRRADISASRRWPCWRRYPRTGGASSSQRFLAQSGLTADGDASGCRSLRGRSKALRNSDPENLHRASGRDQARRRRGAARARYGQFSGMDDHCTARRALCEFPVLTANQVTLWEGLRLTAALRRRHDWRSAVRGGRVGDTS